MLFLEFPIHYKEYSVKHRFPFTWLLFTTAALCSFSCLINQLKIRSLKSSRP